MHLHPVNLLFLISYAHATCFVPIKIPVSNLFRASKNQVFNLCMNTQAATTARADPGDTADDVKGSTILLIRHGETEWNSLGKWQGQQDSPLTDQGISQAAALGHRLKLSLQQVDRVYSSDLPRAKRTAEIINAILAAREPVHEVSLLRERSFGIFEGRTRDEVMKDFPTQYTAFQKFDLVRLTAVLSGRGFSQLL